MSINSGKQIVKLIRNRLQTPDGKMLESTAGKRYVEHRDQNGNLYFLDGGLDYARCSAHGDENYMQEWSNDPHPEKTETQLWFDLMEDCDTYQ
jgi:hypothetical protein